MRSVVNLIVVVGFALFIFGIFSLIYDKLNKILKALESKSNTANAVKWYREDEELPLRDGYYIVFDCFDKSTVMYYNSKTLSWIDLNNETHEIGGYVLYWAELPKPLDKDRNFWYENV